MGPIPLIDELRSHEVPFAVGSLAELAVPLTLDLSDELSERVRRMRIERRYLATRLRAVGANALPSQANFLFLPGAEGVALGEILARAAFRSHRIGHTVCGSPSAIGTTPSA